MASTGNLSPTATGEDYTGFGGQASNAYSSNDVDVIATGGAQQDYYNFSFGVPAGATIDGIEVLVEAAWFTASGCSVGVELSWDSGPNYTTSSKTTGILNATDTIHTLGSPTDTWGRSWAASEFSNANFRLRATHIVSGSSRAAIDHIQVNVHYTSSFIKTVKGVAKASVKTVQGVAIASVKSINGLT